MVGKDGIEPPPPVKEQIYSLVQPTNSCLLPEIHEFSLSQKTHQKHGVHESVDFHLGLTEPLGVKPINKSPPGVSPNPAGSLGLREIWRTPRDSNPQSVSSDASFQDWCYSHSARRPKYLGSGDGPPPCRIRVTGDFCHTKYGASDRNRTYNLMITNQLLCQLSYESLLKFLIPRIEV